MRKSTTSQIHERNRQSWNAATKVHNSHKRDQAKFLCEGGSTLFPEELELLGKLDGKHLVHLQCNAGQDSLSIARMGAKVIGVDISDEAIEFAQKLSHDSGIPCSFVRTDVYDWFDQAVGRGEQFDIVFCSYGAICWLSDLKRWAKGIADILVPGGRFVTVEFHPVSMIFDEQFVLKYSYFGKGDEMEWNDGIEDYVAMAGKSLAPSGYQIGIQNFKNPHPAYEFQWHISAILTALINSGLTIEQFIEYPYANGCKLFSEMEIGDQNRWYPSKNLPSLPMMFGIRATKIA